MHVKEPEEPTFGEVAPTSDETVADSPAAPTENKEEDKPSKRSQKIKRLAEKLTEAERERDEWRKKAEGRVEQPKVTEPSKGDEQYAYPVAKPKLEDFAKPDDFVEAMADWKADAREYKKARQEEAQAQQSAVESHFERVEDARERHDDFDEVVENGEVTFKDDAARNAFRAAIVESDDGPEVLYYLGKHPELVEEFHGMTPVQVAAKVGRIAATMGKSEPSSPEPQRKPSRLITPVGGGSKQPDNPPDRSNLPFREWKRLRKAGQIR